MVGLPRVELGTNGFGFVQLSLLSGLCLHHSHVALGGRRLVSTPSTVPGAPKLGSALPYALPHLGFTEFDDIHARGFPSWCTTFAMSPLL